MERAGFKEWAIVCEALGAGRQSIILRKGGIAEGRQGFSFKHREFFLFPTWFHEQPEKVMGTWAGQDSPSQNAELSEPDGQLTSNVERPTQTTVENISGEALIEIRYSARLESARTITSWDMAEALQPLHILKPEVIEERFNYDDAPGLHVAFVRVFRLIPSWYLPNEKKYGGCRSWVDLPEMPNDVRLEAVLSDQEHSRKLGEFVAILGEQVTTESPSP